MTRLLAAIGITTVAAVGSWMGLKLLTAIHNEAHRLDAHAGPTDRVYPRQRS